MRKSDQTIRINNIRFEVPSRFRHLQKFCVCYQTWDLSVSYIVDERTGNLIVCIYPQDKIKNSEGHRKTLDAIVSETLPKVTDDSDPIPPLLRKLIADYAATGLPPAYIRKEESTIKESQEQDENEL